MGLGCGLGLSDSQRVSKDPQSNYLPFIPQVGLPCPRTEEAGAVTRDEYEEDSSDEEV